MKTLNDLAFLAMSVSSIVAVLGFYLNKQGVIGIELFLWCLPIAFFSVVLMIFTDRGPVCEQE